MKNIINFSIIAHINHGKSTLADRIIEITKNLKINSLKNQSLDTMELEREKGITIKSQCVTLKYKLNEKEYILNLIDTPGHTDFGYEVSRALSACECAILLIDINQGIEAQTISNYKKALNENINIILALNKIDIAKVDIEKQKQNIINLLKIEKNKIVEISAKNGLGVKILIEKLIKNTPIIKERNSKALQALIIDSWFNNYSGITCLIKVENGKITKDEKIITLTNNDTHKITELGILTPEKENKNELTAGEIGFININCKDPYKINIGDTITSFTNPSKIKLKNFKKIPARVYASIYPTEAEDLDNLKISLSKLSLNDSALEYEIQKSSLFGIGFKCGFLGLLHLEIIQERLEREYNLKIIITPPNVTYKIVLKNNDEKYINNPSDMPDNNLIKEIYEPMALTTIITPLNYAGRVLDLCTENRCEKINTTYLNDTISIESELPLSEIIFNFFSKLQTLTNGFSSMDYTDIKYKKSDLVKINILLNDKKIDVLEFITHKTTSYNVGKNLIEKLSKIIPKHLFDIKIQAAIDKKIIAKTSIKGLKKNVIAKCYGGDISRKRKLIEKQKLGKKRMKKFGNIEIPQNAFFAMLDISKK
ncbi:MAG TPA: translation elongation factor 4 [Candidatus Azoamicus sp.]